ncbi:hypothetical protein MROS_2532 [Melioribacter roseus P3M-2]|jgi:hypothetical protein|uniref:Uncharacterized protein n=1 Tax=Melioribacter roseus (strain DSM 23840 / JCM 17771 / VKM B-2668 / P3M-2) TaxID=1191523 RepID=I6YYV1_MELRP|nr:hypothetical protein [Melioribacter roseus]AFN75762.1 hypothetical protein MROS_2532 [Melioribacter roseus P3M-2]
MENQTMIRLNPYLTEKIRFISGALETSIQGTANYLLNHIVDIALENIKEYEKHLNEDMKKAIKEAIKNHFE